MFQRNFGKLVMAISAIVGTVISTGGVHAAPFAPGNIVVYRIGDGSAALTNAATAVFLDEYTPAGAVVQSIALPTTVVGLNKRLTGSGTATSEGLITRSVDGQYLVAIGYDAALTTTPITSSTSAAINRVIARVAANGSVDTTTALTDASTGSNPRGAVTIDGSAFWTTGGAGGIRYSTYGGTTSTQLSTTLTNIRGTGIAGGQLFVSSGSGTNRLAAVGTGIPTTAGQVITALPGVSATASYYQFFFADLDAGVPGMDTVYVVDDTGTANIAKYSLVAGSWTANGSMTLSGARGLTATVSGSTVTLYAASQSLLRTVTDTSGYNATITGTLTTLATAAANTQFRGVALAPAASTHSLSVVHAGSGTGISASVPAGTINCAGSTGTCAATYSAGSMVTLSATPDAGSSFTGWTGACTGTLTCTVTMDAAKSVTATFDLSANYALTVSHAGNGGGNTASVPPGTINCNGSSGVCSASLASPTMVTLAATPNGASSFTGWSGDCTGTGTCTVTMSAARNVTATFESAILTVTHAGSGAGTTASIPAGTINCTGSAGVCTAGYPLGSIVTLSATPGGAATFSGWSGGGCTGTGNCVVTMGASQSVTATFALGVTRIHAVQGNGNASPFANQLVMVEGIVTAVHQGASSLNGFYIQEPDAQADADPLTSEGVFVYTNLAPAAVSVGQLVRVSGTLTEFGTAPNTLTEIVTPTVTVLSSGNPLPAYATVNLPVATLGDLERFEGMRVQFAQTLAVSDHFTLARFGELTLSANGRTLQPTNVVDPNDNPASGNTTSGNSNVAAVSAMVNLNSRSSIILDDASTVSNPPVIPFLDPATNTIRLGTTVANLTGILSQSFGTHRLFADTPPAFNYAARPAAPPAVGGNVKIASMNVLNYFNGNGAGGGFPTSRGADTILEFNRQRAKVLAAVTGVGADVIGLMEIENDGNAATSSIQDLIDGANAISGAGAWAFIADPTFIGTDAIRSAIIYRTAAVAPVGTAISSADPVFNRPPIAQTFRLLSNNEQFTLVVNHFKSKGGSGSGLDNDQGDGQAEFNNTRRLQAQTLLTFMNTLTATPRIITMGDFNAYEQEDPMDVMRAGGLTNIINNGYSYLFAGQSGSLDHALGTAALMANVTGGDKWHINADEPVILDYNVEGKNTTGCTSSCTSPDHFVASQFRASDHDPVLVGLQLIAVQTITFLPATGPLPGATWTVAANSTSGLVVAFSSGSPTICAVSGSTVTITAIGTCIVNANQAGNANFNAAPTATQNIIHTGAQTITFAAPANTGLATGTVLLSASASSGLAVSFASQTAAVCTTSGVNGSTVNLLTVGTCTVRATQAGNALFAAAVPVDRGFSIGQANSSLTVTSNSNPAAFGAPVTLTASVSGANAAGRVTFSVIASGTTVTLCDSVLLTAGFATCSVPGSYQKSSPVIFSVSYTGDANNAAGVVTLMQQVTLTRATLSASVAPVKPFAGRPMKLTALVHAATFGAKVTFRENGAALSGCADVTVAPLPGASGSGVAICNIESAVAGSHNFVATYPHANDAGFEQTVVRVDVVSLPVADYTDMWWAGIGENGWGVSITQHGSLQFIVLYVYDAAGKPTWVVLPNGTWNAAQTAYTGALYRPSGSLFSAYNVQAFKANASVGTATVTYTGHATATLTYTIDGISGSKNIQRQIFAADDGIAKVTVNDLWWGGDAQNGWGLNITQQGRVLFPVWYTYDAAGNTMWYAMPGGTWDGVTYTGDLYATTSSPWLGVPYNAAAFAPVKVGSVVLTFIDQDNATMKYTVNGVTQTKNIVRQPY